MQIKGLDQHNMNSSGKINGVHWMEGNKYTVKAIITNKPPPMIAVLPLSSLFNNNKERVIKD